MQWNIVGFYDDGIAKGSMRNGYKVLGGTSDLNSLNSTLTVCIAIGDPESRASVYSRITNLGI